MEFDSLVEDLRKPILAKSENIFLVRFLAFVHFSSMKVPTKKDKIRKTGFGSISLLKIQQSRLNIMN